MDWSALDKAALDITLAVFGISATIDTHLGSTEVRVDIDEYSQDASPGEQGGGSPYSQSRASVRQSVIRAKTRWEDVPEVARKGQCHLTIGNDRYRITGVRRDGLDAILELSR